MYLSLRRLFYYTIILSNFRNFNSSKMSRGALIVLEGIDKTGKTTQSHLLVESLHNLNYMVERLTFPDRTTNTGQVISKYLSGTEYQTNDQTIHLLFSANRWEHVETIRSKLLSGTSLIVDRYSYSGIAYSVAKGMDMLWCLHPEIGLPQPDLVLFLDSNPEDLNHRAGFGKERYENIPMQRNVLKIFKQFADVYNYWKTVDSSQSIEKTHEILLTDCKKIIEDIKFDNRPLKTIGFSKIKENTLKTHNKCTIIKDTLV